MPDPQIPVNGEVHGEEEPPAPPGAPLTTPETALTDLANAGEETGTLLLPGTSRIPYLFAFDLLLDQAIVSRYVRGLVPAKVVRAVNYTLTWPYFYPPAGSSLPSLKRRADESVWGLLYDARGCKFDGLEAHLNCPNRYHRRGISVLDRGDRRFPAFTYVLTLGDDSAQPPAAEYTAQLAAIARERGLPEEWADYLEGLHTPSP